MSTNTLVNENLNTNNSTSTINNDGPIAHLDHMLNSLHDEQQQQSARMSSSISSMDTFDHKSHRMNHRPTPRSTITDGKIVECSSENAIIYRYYTGESCSVIDEHFDKALKQPVSFNSARSIPARDSRTSSYGYPTMMSPSSSFWPNFMASPASYPHPTYLPTSPNEYSDWMHHHHHHAYRSPYSSNSTGVSGAATMSNNHLHPIGSPNSTNNNNNNNANNTGRYHHHHTPSDMDVVRVAAIGVAAAAQMFHHDKQSHHAYTPASHHFDYHLGGSMMATASYAFPTQSFDLMGSGSSGIGLDNSNMKDPSTSSPWYTNHHLSC